MGETLPGQTPEQTPELEQRVLGRTGLRVSALGLGGAGIGGLYRRFDDDEPAAEVVRAALDAGITYIDTAPLYGKGTSERRIGLALRGHPARDRCVVATKLGYVPEDYDYSYDATVRSIHASLERLGLDHLPLAQIHELRAETWDAVMAPRGALGALRDLQRQGIVGHLGATSSESDTLRRVLAEAPDAFETLFVWKRYHLLDPSFGVAVLPRAAELGLGVIVGTPFAGGLLASGSGPGAKYFYRDAPQEQIERTRRLEAACSAAGVPLAAAALRFCLSGPGVAVVVAGAETRKHVGGIGAMLRVDVHETLLT
ncbi:MAG: aldo/keto reductase, partial [Chloroflexota bacterium]